MRMRAIRGLLKRKRGISLSATLVVIISAWQIGCSAIGGKGPGVQHSGDGGCTIQRGLVILVEFPDVRHDINPRYAQKRFFQEMNEYVQEMSYGRVCIDGDITAKWNRMPRSISQYKISPRNLEVDKSRINLLIRDAIDAVDPEVKFARYSFAVIFMGARMKEYGMMGLCGYPGMLGWGTQDVLKTKSGQVVKGGVAIYCYQAHLGTLFHDVAHILGGVQGGNRRVPCLYDHDLQAKPGPPREIFLGATVNMGAWDPMSCHYYKWELPPPGLSSWTKLRLNWMDASKVKVVKPGEKTEFLLGPLEDGNAETLTIKVSLSQTTYYLIENRQPIGFDKYLPGRGVLVMYADDQIPECRHGRSPVKLMNADPKIPHLDGAAFDIGKKENFIDEKNGFQIHLAGKIGNSYKIQISPYRK
jgi:M6 family metalloprotease-like protein